MIDFMSSKKSDALVAYNSSIPPVAIGLLLSKELKNKSHLLITINKLLTNQKKVFTMQIIGLFAFFMLLFIVLFVLLPRH